MGLCAGHGDFFRFSLSLCPPYSFISLKKGRVVVIYQCCFLVLMNETWQCNIIILEETKGCDEG